MPYSPQQSCARCGHTAPQCDRCGAATPALGGHIGGADLCHTFAVQPSCYTLSVREGRRWHVLPNGSCEAPGCQCGAFVVKGPAVVPSTERSPRCECGHITGVHNWKPRFLDDPE